MNPDYFEQLGQTLRAARKQLGLTQTHLALAAGVGLRFVVDLEAGKQSVRLSHVVRVAEALGGTFTLFGLSTPLTATKSGKNQHGT